MARTSNSSHKDYIRAPEELDPSIRNIVLTGFMGSGKSTVGRRLARRLGWSFVDTDLEIEERAGKPIVEIFAEAGEQVFRDLETQVARECVGRQRTVIATGGGIVMREENRKALNEAGLVVYLKASVETIWQRTQHTAKRPLLKTENPRQKIQELLVQRKPVYALAPVRVRVGGRPVGQIVELIIRRANQHARRKDRAS
jgi:shikimate kinase